MKKLLKIILALFGLLLVWLAIPKTRLDSSEGLCTQNNQCQYVGGCGHGLCTSDKEKIKAPVFSNCFNMMYPDHPIAHSYSCTCLKSKRKCGWKRGFIGSLFQIVNYSHH